jgi:steroid delta-isomerase-like uncharacterized protein
MAILNRWFEEVWNQGREASIDELMAPDTVAHGLVDGDGIEIAGIEPYRAFYRSFRGALSDVHVDVQDTLSDGDLEAARFVVTARHTGEGLGKPPRGRNLKLTGMSIVRVKDGKIAEAWNNIDFATMFQQMD